MQEHSGKPLYGTKEWQTFRNLLIEKFGAYCAKCEASGPGVVCGRERFATERDARAHLFDRMEAGDVQRYFEKKFPRPSR